jgi:hypothetical protein
MANSNTGSRVPVADPMPISHVFLKKKKTTRNSLIVNEDKNRTLFPV